MQTFESSEFSRPGAWLTLTDSWSSWRHSVSNPSSDPSFGGWHSSTVSLSVISSMTGVGSVTKGLSGRLKVLRRSDFPGVMRCKCRMLWNTTVIKTGIPMLGLMPVLQQCFDGKNILVLTIKNCMFTKQNVKGISVNILWSHCTDVIKVIF